MTLCPELAKEYNIITIANINSLQLSTYDRQPGTRVQVSCLSNTFKVLGPTSLTCLRNGTWDKQVPKCVSRKEYIASQMKPKTTVSPVKPKEGAAQGASSASSIDSSLAVFSGNLVPYIITVCVLAIMFLSLVFILTYLVRMRKIVNRKINEIEEKDRRPAHVRAVDSLRSLQSGSATIYDYFRHTDSPTLSASTSSQSTTHRSKYETQWDRPGASPLYNDDQQNRQRASSLYDEDQTNRQRANSMYDEGQQNRRENASLGRDYVYSNIDSRFKRQKEGHGSQGAYLNSGFQGREGYSNGPQGVYGHYDPRVKRALSHEILKTAYSNSYGERFRRENDRDTRSLHHANEDDRWFQL